MRTEVVVNTLLKEAKKKKVTFTHLQIQKILYFLHGHFLAKTGKPLIDEPFEAWQYGPVVNSLYYKLNKYGSAPIVSYIPSLDKTTGKETFFVVNDNHKDFWDVLSIVWAEYANKDGLRLSALSHKKGSPWDKATTRFEVIPNDVIKEYFQSQGVSA